MQLPLNLHNMKHLAILAMVGALCALPAKAQSVIIFTMTGQFLQPALGYTQGQAITLTFTTTDVFSLTGSSEFTEEQNVWLTNEPGDSEIWSDISSTSFLGTYSAPEASSGQLAMAGPGVYPSQIDTGGISLGLRTPENTPITEIEIEIPEVTEFIYGSAFLQPVAYFQDYLGDYTGLDGASGIIRTSFGSVSFSINSLTIATATLSTVPEPGMTTALAGIVSLGFVFSRRRTRHQTKA
jgi:hypothetical protein